MIAEQEFSQASASVGRALLKLLGARLGGEGNRLGALPKDGASVAFPGFCGGSRRTCHGSSKGQREEDGLEVCPQEGGGG